MADKERREYPGSHLPVSGKLRQLSKSFSTYYPAIERGQQAQGDGEEAQQLRDEREMAKRMLVREIDACKADIQAL